MNLDEKIKEALKMDAKEVEMVLSREDGLFSQLFGIFRGSMIMWNIFGLVLALVTAVLMIWSGYSRLFVGVIGHLSCPELYAKTLFLFRLKRDR